MNWTPILVATVASYVIGALWYGPLFGKMWMKLSGMTKAKMGKSEIPAPMVAGFVVNLVVAIVVSIVMSFTGWSGWENGALLGFWLWLGFVATFTFGPVLWMNQKLKLWLLNNTHNLLVMMVIGAIVGGM